MKTQHICIAIGVLKQLSDMAYSPEAETQSREWEGLRDGLYHVRAALDDVAQAEINGGDHVEQ